MIQRGRAIAAHFNERLPRDGECREQAATHGRIGAMFMVRGDDSLTMAAERAGQVGIDLMDG
jgi:hypothetical protein